MSSRKYSDQITVLPWKVPHGSRGLSGWTLRDTLNFSVAGLIPSGWGQGEEDVATPLLLCLSGPRGASRPRNSRVYFRLQHGCSHQKNWKEIIQNPMLVFSVIIVLVIFQPFCFRMTGYLLNKKLKRTYLKKLEGASGSEVEDGVRGNTLETEEQGGRGAAKSGQRPWGPRRAVTQTWT